MGSWDVYGHGAIVGHVPASLVHISTLAATVMLHLVLYLVVTAPWSDICTATILPPPASHRHVILPTKRVYTVVDVPVGR